MDTPRLSGYPFDQTRIREIQARQRARELERLAQKSAQKSAQEPATGLRRLWQLLSR
jgi:hypothetical protein